MDFQIKVKCYLFKRVTKQRNLHHPQSKKKRNNFKNGTEKPSPPAIEKENGKQFKKWHYNTTAQWLEKFWAPALKRVPDLPKMIKFYDKQFII